MEPNRIAALLADYLSGSADQRPFDWPSNNCCHFAARWVAFATGRDPMQSLATTPDAMAARRLVRQLGGGALRDAVSAALGADPIDPALARTGDLLLLPASSNEGAGGVVGICNDRHAVVRDAGGAVAFLPIAQAVCAWRVFGDGVAP